MCDPFVDDMHSVDVIKGFHAVPEFHQQKLYDLK